MSAAEPAKNHLLAAHFENAGPRTAGWVFAEGGAAGEEDEGEGVVGLGGEDFQPGGFGGVEVAGAVGAHGGLVAGEPGGLGCGGGTFAEDGEDFDRFGLSFHDDEIDGAQDEGQ